MGSVATIFLMGWGGILSGILLAIVGIFRRNQWFLFGSAVAVAGFSWYLANTPAFGLAGYIFPILFMASGFAIKAGQRILAVALIVPFVVVVGWIATHVLLLDG